MSELFDMTNGDDTMDVVNYVQMFDGTDFTSTVYSVPMRGPEITNALDSAMVNGGRIAAFFTVPMKVAAITETGMISKDGVALLIGSLRTEERNEAGAVTTIALFMDDQTAAALGNHLLNWCSLELMQQTLLERMQVDGEVPQDVLDEMEDLGKRAKEVDGTDD